MKLGIIRCMQTEDYCPGTTDFKMIREHKGVFEGINEEIELIVFSIVADVRPRKLSLEQESSWSVRRTRL